MSGVQTPRVEKLTNARVEKLTKGKLKKLSRQAAIQKERERLARLRDGACTRRLFFFSV